MKTIRKIPIIFMILLVISQFTLAFAVEVRPVSPTDPDIKSDVIKGLNQPYGLSTDYLGNVYIADTYNNMIKVITANGLELVAGGFDGKNTMGFPRGGLIDGNADVARFNKPRDVFVTKAGIIYVADTGNNVIRKIEGGVVSTISGNGKAGFVNGPAADAQFNLPSALALAKDGKLYVADTLNSSIRVINKDGSVETMSFKPDNKTLTSAKLNEPSDLFFDDEGTLYILDSGNQAVKRVKEGVMSLIAGSVMDLNEETGYVKTGLVNGQADAAKFNFPKGFAMDSKGNIFISDSWNHVIRVVTKDGKVQTYSGSPFSGNTNGDLKLARYNTPTGLVIKNDTLVIADMWNNVIKEVKIDYNDVSFGYTTEALKALVNLSETSDQWTFWENKGKVALEKPIIMEKGLYYLPFKATMQHYGYEISWNAQERKVLYAKADDIGTIDAGRGMVIFDNNSYLSLDDFEKIVGRGFKVLDAYKCIIGVEY